MSFPLVSLGSLCDFLYGDGLPEGQRRGGEFAVYGSNGVVGWHDEAITKGPTIIIGRKGSIGEVHRSHLPCWPIDTTYYVETTKRPCDLTWLYYALIALDLTRLNKSAAVPGLNRDDAYEQKIIYPPLPEQQRIAAILERADRLRRLRRYALELSEGYLQAVFVEIFGDPVRNPKGWRRRTLRSVSQIFSDGPFGSDLKTEHYTSSGIRVVRLQNVGVGNLIDDDKAYISETHFAGLSRHRCQPGDVIIGTLGDPNLRACILPTSIPIALNKADCVQMRVNDKEVNPEYACWLLNLPQTLDLAAGMVHGQTRARINMGRLAELEVPVAPLELQGRFAFVVHQYERLRAQQREAQRQAEQLFGALLDRAFRGEL
jgi:type I restriction enzyme S subunit